MGFLSIELEDLVDVCSLCLVESAVFSWRGQYVLATHREVGVGVELKTLARLYPGLILHTPVDPRVAILPDLLDNFEQECKILSQYFKLTFKENPDIA